jgi:2-dehydropantoate 2-reductase
MNITVIGAGAMGSLFGALLAEAGKTGLVLAMQNGMGNTDTLAEILEPSQIIAVTTSHGATFLGPGTIRHAGEGDTVIGPWSTAGMTGAEKVAEVFHRANIVTRVVVDVRTVLWEKLLINVGINAITALAGIKNGQILQLEWSRRLSREAVEEAMADGKVSALDIIQAKKTVENGSW